MLNPKTLQRVDVLADVLEASRQRKTDRSSSQIKDVLEFASVLDTTPDQILGPGNTHALGERRSETSDIKRQMEEWRKRNPGRDFGREI